MKNGLILISLLLSVETFAQKTEFGLIFEGSFPLLSSKDRMIQDRNANHPIPQKADLIRPNSFWNTQHLAFSYFPKRVQNLSISIGVRSFNFGWEEDTIARGYYSGSINPPTGYWKEVYAKRESKIGSFLPTVSIGYDFTLPSAFSLKPILSYGFMQFMTREKRNSFAFDPSEQDGFDHDDEGLMHGALYEDVDFGVFDIQIGCNLAYRVKSFSIYTGFTYYHHQTVYFNEKVAYNALHLNCGICYRF